MTSGSSVEARVENTRAAGTVAGRDARSSLRTLFVAGTSGDLSDRELLRRFLEGPETIEEEAFEAIVARHGPMVERICRGVLRNAHDAGDAAQAVFLILARKARSIERQESVASWLYGVARRVASRARAAEQRRIERERRGAIMAATSCRDKEDHHESWERLCRELDRLAEPERAAVVLCHLEGLSHAEAAGRLRCPLRTLQSRLLRARTRLRDRLSRGGRDAGMALACLTAARGVGRVENACGWSRATARAAVEFGAGRAVTGTVSERAVELAEGVLTTMIKQSVCASGGVMLLSGAMMAGAAWSLTTPGDSRGGASPVTQTGRPSDDSGQSATSSEIAQAPATQRKSSRTKAKAAAGAETKELSRDDGKMAGRKSIAGGGHLVKFESPGEGWKLTSVKLHGSRYGYPQPPDEDIVIYLCDESFKPVAEYKFPYAKFERGDAKWVTLPTQPTELPPVFWIGVNFNPEATKGVYMSHDAAGSGTSSVGVPGGRRPPRPFEQGDWLIRAVVEPAEAGKSPTPK